MSDYTMSYEEFVSQAKRLACLSEELCDGWFYSEEKQSSKLGAHLKKQVFLEFGGEHLKAEYVVSYSASYAVPLLSFNIWRPTGVLLALDEIQKISRYRMNSRAELYSAVTQQEHHLFQRPYFTVHPCHTAALLASVRHDSQNILLTFLSVMAPLVGLTMKLEYAVTTNKNPG